MPKQVNKILQCLLKALRSRALNTPKRLWAESLEQHQKGWLTAPSPITSSDKPFILLGEKMDVASRFGAEQADKLRDCDDLRYSMTNLACVGHTPIKLASWDHIAEMCRSSRHTLRDWHLFKADHEAA